MSKNILDQYVENAVLTESPAKEISVNPHALIAIMKAFVHTGMLLDQFKKHAFYGKEINMETFSEDLQSAIGELTDLEIFSSNLEEKEVITAGTQTRIFHSLIGMATESVELVELLINALENKTDVDVKQMFEELGDVDWYHALGVHAAEFNWADILHRNNLKLLTGPKSRYKGSFTSVHAIDRDVDAEHEVFEDIGLTEEENQVLAEGGFPEESNFITGDLAGVQPVEVKVGEDGVGTITEDDVPTDGDLNGVGC